MSVSTSVTITPLLPPIAAFTHTPASPFVGDTVNFDGSGSHTQETSATIVSYSWNFGDGVIGTGQKPSHIYATSGTKSVVLMVTDSLGSTDTETASIVVQELPTWTVVISATAGGSVSPSGTRTYASGQASDAITATRNSNYVFDHWELDGGNVGSANPYTVPAQSSGTSHTLRAIFTSAPLLVAEAGGPIFRAYHKPDGAIRRFCNWRGHALSHLDMELRRRRHEHAPEPEPLLCVRRDFRR